MTDVLIALPAEALQTVGFVADALPGVLTVNAALRGFGHRRVFRWNLSLLIDAARWPATACRPRPSSRCCVASRPTCVAVSRPLATRCSRRG
jgi:hypothetical protein